MPLLSKKDIFETINSRTNSKGYESENSTEELIKIGYPNLILLLSKLKSLDEAIIKIV